MSMFTGRPSDPLGEKLKVADEEENTPTSTAVRTMEDVPPEVLTIILELMTRDARLEGMLGYRLVSSQWKEIVDSMIEKRIVSGQFKVFQGALKIMGAGRRRQYDLLHVQASPTVFQNPFPFNSLLLTGSQNGVDFYFDPDHPPTPMTLPVLASTFGGNLTSFSLHDQVIPIDTLATMLGSMPRLKLLSLADVKQVNSIIKPDAVLPVPPRLPSFATLEVKSSPAPSRHGNNLLIQNEKRNVLYVWLITSYADQLERLNLKTHDQLPPLRKRHQYNLSLPRDNSFRIATTSDSAFSNLKELNIARPSGDFLRLSDTPALQRLSVTGLVGEGLFGLREQVNFIVKCGATLEKLSLDVSWLQLVGFEDLLDINVIPGLKTLTIPYPSEDFQECILRRKLLAMFPGLEVLQLLHFQPECLDNAIWTLAQDLPANEAIRFVHGKEGVDEILTLKERLASLLHQHSIAVGLSKRAAVRSEMAKIFRRLVDLGEKEEKIIVEQLIQRRGLWNRGANLKIVSVSSGGTPNGDVCLIRRPVDA